MPNTTSRMTAMRYRRAHVSGGTFFFTVNLDDRSSGLLVEHIDALRHAVRAVKQRHAFQIDAWVVLPDHMHAVWTPPPGDADFSTRWMLIKAGFSRAIGRGERIRRSRVSNGERGIWQRRFWEHQINDEADLANHVDYVHINPVKHGHSARASDWPYSSIHRYIRQGHLNADWACDVLALRSGGERCPTSRSRQNAMSNATSPCTPT
jgi:putative transposase